MRVGHDDVGPRVGVLYRETTIEGFRESAGVAELQPDDDAIAFSWHGSIEANRDGELTFAIDGRAERDFDYRRIGICVLHPWRTYVGARIDHERRIVEIPRPAGVVFALTPSTSSRSRAGRREWGASWRPTSPSALS